MKNILKISFLLCLLMSVASCKKDEKECPEPLIESNGLSANINNLVPEEVITVLQDLSVPVHRGGTPPVVNGVYNLEPIILYSSNVAGDITGTRFSDGRLKLEQQDQNNLKIVFNMKQFNDQGVTSSTYEGIGSFISGHGNYFSIFVPSKDHDLQEDERSLSVIIISGELTPNGISDFHMALTMLDNDYDGNGSTGDFISNKSTRHFLDGSGVAIATSVYKKSGSKTNLGLGEK